MKKVINNVKIIASCKPYKIVDNPFKDIIEEIFTDECLSEHEKKQILVSCIGFLGKQIGHASKPRLYTTVDDAINDNLKYKGWIKLLGFGKPYVDKEEICHYKKKLYAIIQSNSVQLSDGFLPIQHMIYDQCRLNVAKTVNMAEKAGCEVLGVKTDCVFVSEEDAKKLDIPWKGEIDGCDMANIGKLKKEKGRTPNYKAERDDDLDCAEYSCPWIKKRNQVITYKLNDEYNMKEFYQIFDTYQRVLLRAKLPGSGKSYSCKDYVKTKNHAIACPQNAQARKLQLEGFNAMTLYDLCGTLPNDDGTIS